MFTLTVRLQLDRYLRGNLVDRTGPGECLHAEYEQFPWVGQCSYLEIYNPGIYTFGTLCACGTEEAVTPDVNERLCVWDGSGGPDGYDNRCEHVIQSLAGSPSPYPPPPPPGIPPSPSPLPSPPSPPVAPPLELMLP